MTKKAKFLLAGDFLLLTALLSLCLGAVPLTLGELVAAVAGGPRDTGGFIFWYSRLPRTWGCLLSGGALAASGCILQNVLGNKLASPGIIGVNAGAGLGVTLCCSLGLLSGWAVAAGAFGGAMLACFAVMLLARKTGASRTTVILSGVAMNSILNAFRDALTTLVPDAAALSGDFRVGGFSALAPSRLIPAGTLIFFGLILCFSMCNELDILALGGDFAHSLGMKVARVRTTFLLLAALLAGASVSFAGLLSFVGLLVPHMARRFVGSESRYQLPFSVLLGGGFVTGCDLVSRLLFAPYELPVGILMSVIGGPFFLWLLLKGKGGRHG